MVTLSYHVVEATAGREAAIEQGNLMERLGELSAWLREKPWGLFVDIDGTIADIVARPEDARVRPGCRRALESLAQRLTVVGIVTGRAVQTARQMVGVEGLIYYGNHGLERWDSGGLSVAPEARQHLGRLQEAGRLLQTRLVLPGVIVEEKGVGLSIHFRMSPRPDHMRSTVLAILDDTGIRQWMDVRVGKMHIDLRLPLDVDKGTAVRSLIQEYRLQGAVVLGDDLTDVDSFRATRQLQEEDGFVNISVAVVGRESPEEVQQEAAYTLPGVAAVEEFLLWLSQEMRTPPPE